MDSVGYLLASARATSMAASRKNFSPGCSWAAWASRRRHPHNGRCGKDVRSTGEKLHVVRVKGLVAGIGGQAQTEQFGGLLVFARRAQVDGPIVDRGKEVALGGGIFRIEPHGLGIGGGRVAKTLIGQQIDAAIVINRRHQFHVRDLRNGRRSLAAWATEPDCQFGLGRRLRFRWRRRPVDLGEPPRAGRLDIERFLRQFQPAHGVAGNFQTHGLQIEAPG